MERPRQDVNTDHTCQHPGQNARCNGFDIILQQFNLSIEGTARLTVAGVNR